MTNLCNFNCGYCARQFKPTFRYYLPVKSIIRTLKDTGKPWIVGLTGGEPFIYPNFIGVCKELTKHYKIAIDSNLSINSKVREFANEIDPKKVQYIYVSTHIEEREKRNGVEDFIKNILLLKEKKFNVNVNYVLRPKIDEKFKRYYKYFKSKGIELKPKPFRGKYEGKMYPDAYSEDEKRMILKYDSHALTKLPFNLKGMRCDAGKRLFVIKTNGIAVRCYDDNTILGNIFQGIKLNNNTKPCKADKCTCFGYDLVENPEKSVSLP